MFNPLIEAKTAGNIENITKPIRQDFAIPNHEWKELNTKLLQNDIEFTIL